jgi:hypothetical protein
MLLASVLLLGACGGAPQSKDAVKQAILEHLQKGSGLDMNLMNMEIVALTFNGKEAHATVAFRPKSQPEQGMEMSYTLEAAGNKWNVVKKTGAGGVPHGQPQQESPLNLPPGHPPMGGSPAAPPTETPR